MNDIPYLLRGIMPLTTGSSTLISASKYLNDPRLRDWIAEIVLKRNGPNMPAQAEMYPIVEIVDSLRDHDAVEALFTAERRNNPAFGAWMDANCHMQPLDVERLRTLPEGSFGRIFYREVIEKNFEVVIYDLPEPKTQLQMFNMRATQTHDMEHVLTGGDFNYMGELVPAWCRITSQFKHLSPELAAELSILNMFVALRYTVRTLLHYPTVWTTAQDAVERGMRVGHASEPIYALRFEDAFELPLEEARAALGVRGAVDVDTSAPSQVWAGATPAAAGAAALT